MMQERGSRQSTAEIILAINWKLLILGYGDMETILFYLCIFLTFPK